ncbi:MAG: NAD-dependent epimerase/dehydratase family protein [Streptosporangiales bacterium]|nr:NAD-dependent epimerase/dehydratase family protein [Streptosporangiales bacterium]
MRILVAGDRGYIGAVLVPMLRTAGHDVDGLDIGLYERCDLLDGPVPTTSAPRDVRAVNADLLAGYDAVICLAALSNDPLGHLNRATTFSVNLDGTLQLATAAKAAGVSRFLFASSCSLYGTAGSSAVAEDAPMHPVTPYGETKAVAEERLSALADDDFSPTYLRNATAYGVSPRLRSDIVVNDLTGLAVTTGAIELLSDGTPWRPLVHVADISRSFLAMLEAPRELVHDKAFNVGRAQDNVQVRDIAELVRDAVPGSTVTFSSDAAPDLRDYRVDFGKLADTFPELELSCTIQGGITELVDAYLAHGMTYQELRSPRFVRLGRIRQLLRLGLLDEELRRTTDDTFPVPAEELTDEAAR